MNIQDRVAFWRLTELLKKYPIMKERLGIEVKTSVSVEREVGESDGKTIKRT